jgi:hypothetical protein
VTLRALILTYSALVAAAQALACLAPVQAQDLDCAAYILAVKGTSGSVAIIPDSLLTDTTKAVKCLIRTIDSIKEGAQTTSLQDSIRNQFLGATGALRAIISKLNSDDEKTENGRNLDGFIKTFRDNRTITSISILTYGARSETYEVRSNSLLILANVIDNTTVCVPLNHLWDPEIGPSAEGLFHSRSGQPASHDFRRSPLGLPRKL